MSSQQSGRRSSLLVVHSSVSCTSFFPLATFTRTREKDGWRREGGEVGLWCLLLISEIHAVPAGGGICVPLPLYLVRMADVEVGSQLSRLLLKKMGYLLLLGPVLPGTAKCTQIRFWQGRARGWLAFLIAVLLGWITCNCLFRIYNYYIHFCVFFGLDFFVWSENQISFGIWDLKKIIF